MESENSLMNVTPENIPLQYAKQYLRVDHDLDDLEISLALVSAQSYVRKFIGIEDGEPMDIELIIPILALTSTYYENKTAIGTSNQKIDAILESILSLNRRNFL